MLWLFGQTWIWILVAFVLGLVIGFLISLLFRKKKVEVTEEAVVAPAVADTDSPATDSAPHGADLADSGTELAPHGADLADGDTGSDGDTVRTALPVAALAAGAGSVAAATGAADTESTDGDTELAPHDTESADSDTGILALTTVPAAGADSDDDASTDAAVAASEQDDAALAAEAAGANGELDTAEVQESDAPADTEVATSADSEITAATTEGDTEATEGHGEGAEDGEGADVAAAAATDGEVRTAETVDEPELAAANADSDPAADAAGTDATAGTDAADGTGADSLSGQDDGSDSPAEDAEGAATDGSAGGTTAALPLMAAATVAAPYGPGSAAPLADGAAPSEDYTVKGNADSMLFHTVESPYYSRTKAEVWFATAADAEAAGFTAWNRKRAARSGEAEEVAVAPEAAASAVQGVLDQNEDAGPGYDDDTLATESTTESIPSPRPTGALPFAGLGGGSATATLTEPATATVPEQAPATEPALAAGPYGAGSAMARPDGSAPGREFTVKGNADSMLFHTIESPYFTRTKAEVWFVTAADAEAAGFTAWNRPRPPRAAAAPTWEAGPYPGSAKPLANGASPSGEFTVKGNADSMLFHTIESPYFTRTKAEVWFASAADAEAAGFSPWNRRRS